MTLPLVVAITGATGVVYGVELLRALKDLGQPAHLILSEAAGMNFAIVSDDVHLGLGQAAQPADQLRGIVGDAATHLPRSEHCDLHRAAPGGTKSAASIWI